MQRIGLAIAAATMIMLICGCDDYDSDDTILIGSILKPYQDDPAATVQPSGGITRASEDGLNPSLLMLRQRGNHLNSFDLDLPQNASGTPGAIAETAWKNGLGSGTKKWDHWIAANAHAKSASITLNGWTIEVTNNPQFHLQAFR